MKRLIVAFALFLGGVASEMRSPLHCSLLHASRPRLERRRF